MLKKILPLFLILCSVAAAFPIPAKTEDAEESGRLATAFELAEDLYARHQERHTFDALYASENGIGLSYTFPVDHVSDLLLSCGEFNIFEARKLPSSAKQIKELFQQWFDVSMTLSEGGHPQPVNLGLFNDTYSGKITTLYPAETWWLEEKRDDASVLIGPLLFRDNDSKEIINNAVYGFCIFFTPENTRMWFFTDQDLVRDMVQRLSLSPNMSADDTATRKKLLAWLEENQSLVYLAPTPEPTPEPTFFYESDGFFTFSDMEDPTPSPSPEPTPEPTTPPTPEPTAILAAEPAATEVTLAAAAAPETTAPTAAPTAQTANGDSSNGKIIGKVTVLGEKSVNLRDKGDQSGAVVGQAKAGVSYSCISISDSGWYEIIYRQITAYVSPALVKYEGF